LTINFKSLENVVNEIARYRNSELMIVTKNRSTSDIETLIKKDFKLFGENKVQEAKLKYENIIDRKNFDLHLIGPLQTNKVKLALKIFDTIQTIDRYSLIDEVSKFISKSLPKTKNFYIQVNIGKETQKSGVSIENLFHLYEYSLNKNLKIEGLMCIPPNLEDPMKYFELMNSLRDKINKNLKLSMGMSNDYKFALKLNSNIIRIGSLIFS